VSLEDADLLRVTAADFEHALQFDLKPAFGISDEQLDTYVFNGGHWSPTLCCARSCDSHVLSLSTGIIPWGHQVQEVLDLGKAVVQQTMESVRTPLVSVLLRGTLKHKEKCLLQV